MKYDLAIIGGGPAGYTAAEQAASKGLATILFEKSTLGGVCLNEGCIPTKTLLYSAKILDTIKGASKYGITAENESFDLGKIVARKNKVVRKLVAGIKGKLSRVGATVINAEAKIRGTNEADGSIIIEAEDKHYIAAKLIVCTGSEAIIPPINGLRETDYWTSKEALQSKERPNSIAIIGGGVIGMEFAAFYSSLGTEVHVVEMADKILGAIDGELSATLHAEYVKRGVKFYINHKVTNVTNSSITLETVEGDTLEVGCEKTLICVGRRPIIEGFGLETLGLESYKNGVFTNEYMQTSQPNVYACGDITAISLLAHTAVSQAEVAVHHILNEPRPMAYKAIPGVVYTNPEIASVGYTEHELEKSKTPYTVKKLPMTYSGRFVAENEQVNGICKLILSSDDVVIGAHMLGNPASELITIAGMAIQLGLTSKELSKFIFPHPTAAEILKEVAL